MCIPSSEPADELGRSFRWVITALKDGTYEVKYRQVEPYSAPGVWLVMNLPQIVEDGKSAFRTEGGARNEVGRRLGQRATKLGSFIEDWKRRANDNQTG